MLGAVYLLSCILVLVTADSDGAIASPTCASASEAVGSYDEQPVKDTDSKRFSQCEFIKKLFRVSYDQLQGDRAPKLNNLTLVYRTVNGTKIFKIDTAAESLREQRELEEDERLIIFVHGYRDNPTKEAFTKMTQAFLAYGHTNLVALDASSVLSGLYPSSSSYVRFIGQKLGQLLADIARRGQKPSDIHIIGHSLGAHIAGFAGKAFRELTGARLGRISGLDPAGPCFNDVAPDARLRRTDAEFVSVIHTDTTMYGIKEPVGHKDYYPNGGWLQPGCAAAGCSHARAWLLFAESVAAPRAFPARSCSDWDAFKRGLCEPDISYMGYTSEPGASNGHFFLQTGGKQPYGLGLNGTKYKK